MDERAFVCELGQRVPDWDCQHRLYIDKSVSPSCKDTATIFKINSTFMDVTDQPYFSKQEKSIATFIAALGFLLFSWPAKIILNNPPKSENIIAHLILPMIILFLMFFSYLVFKAGRDEFFSLTRRPIRFNRKEQKIHTIRRRRFFAKPGQGDITWEVPWDDSVIFCIHKGVGSFGNPYHIRCYTVDDDGNVVRAFAIGREWEGAANLEGLLSQWNYWCWYMNHGPADLPQPALYFKEKEDITESFLFCMYDLGFTASSLSRLVMMPLILLMTSHRLMALWTCREPVWPAKVEQASVIEAGDPFEQPRGDTPVGWAQTALAREAQTYPFDPKRKTHGWQGEPDGARNAESWAQDIPPQIYQEAAP